MQWLYRKCMECAEHKHSYAILLLISFANSSIFLVSPYYPLMAMCYARPQHWLRYSLGSAIACVAGGAVGWLIGAWFWDALSPLAYQWIPGLTPHVVESLRPQPGASLLVAFLAITGIVGLSPVPYKVVAISSGIFMIPLPMFLLASFIGRAPRSLITGALVAYGSQKCRAYIERHLLIISLAGLAFTVVSFVYGPAIVRSFSSSSASEKKPPVEAAAPATTPAPPVVPASNVTAP